MLGGMRAVTWTQVAQYIILITAYLLPAIWMSTVKTGVPIPQIMYGSILGDIATMEQALGVATKDFHSLPFDGNGLWSIEARDFFFLIFCLMVGTASLPHILMRFFTTPTVREARKSVGWSLFFIFLLYFTAPAYAAFAKFNVMDMFVQVGGTLAYDQIPAWMYRWGNIGGNTLISICGAPVTDQAAVMAACGAEKAAGFGFSDLMLGKDMIVLSTPEIAGMPWFVIGLVGAGGFAAALSTADGLLLAIANALSHDIYYKMIDPKADGCSWPRPCCWWSRSAPRCWPRPSPPTSCRWWPGRSRWRRRGCSRRLCSGSGMPGPRTRARSPASPWASG